MTDMGLRHTVAALHIPSVLVGAVALWLVLLALDKTPAVENLVPATDTAASVPPSVVCLVMTTPQYWSSKGQAVANTWLRRCDDYRFVYAAVNQTNIHHPKAIPTNFPEGRDHLTAKLWAGLITMYKTFGTSVDWYFKADDDSYVVVENLKHLLSQYDHTEPHYLGFWWGSEPPKGFHSGGSGYALSSAAVRILVEQGAENDEACLKDGVHEDMKIGMCLESYQIYPTIVKDAKGREMFHIWHPIHLLEKNDYFHLLPIQYKKEGVEYHVGDTQKGFHVMSPDLISFHYVDPAHIYMYDYLLYDVTQHQQYTSTHA